MDEAERSAARVFSTLLREPSFEDAVIWLAKDRAERYEKETIRFVREDNARQAAISAAKAGEWEKILVEMQSLARKHQGD